MMQMEKEGEFTGAELIHWNICNNALNIKYCKSRLH